MPNISDNFTQAHVLQAVDKIESENIQGQSQKYEVVINGKHYPPPLVCQYADYFASGQKDLLKVGSFRVGQNTDCFNTLERLGFDIVEKVSYKSRFIEWVSLNNKTNYINYLDKFWKQVENQKNKFVDEFESSLEALPELVDLIQEAKPIYEFDANNLVSLKRSLSKLLNKRISSSQGGSAESAGISQLIEWKKELEIINMNLENCSTKLLVENLPKPFLLLAGLSGTGKSRFVREQAEKSDLNKTNYCLVSVRPDWHEPSDLLGYVSRLGKGGAEFITTDVLRFMVKAWLAIIDLPNSFNDTADTYQVKDLNSIPPFWLCLDEMNLAPVEQYFADYLSVIETRKWEGGKYTCDPLLKSDVFAELEQNGLTKLREALDLTGTQFDGLWKHFVNNGISVPFNMIVAGTVNMDETTHGFSRKVIDRALTFDFGEFFPNDSQEFFNPTKFPKVLSYPTVSQASLADLNNIAVDKDGKQTIAFFDAVNAVLKGTMFELAYRALNELFVSVISFKPKTDLELQAVWDDFLMMKVLPRIEGDEDKLTDQKQAGLLKTLLEKLNTTECLQSIWEGEKRPDLFRESIQSPKTAISIACRSRHKLEWMQQRLIQNGFTSFWP